MIRRKRQMLSAIFLVASLLVAPSVGSTQYEADPEARFKAFLAGFQQAVAHKDHARLEHLMMSSFDYFQAQHVAHATVFRQLDAAGGTQWINLQQSVQGNPAVVTQEYKHRPARMMQCRATQDIYRCLIVFQQDNLRDWRWKAMIMPHRY